MEGTSPKGHDWFTALDYVYAREHAGGLAKVVLRNLRHHPDWGYLAELTEPCIPSTCTHQDLGALVDGAIELHANPAYRMDAQRRAT